MGTRGGRVFGLGLAAVLCAACATSGPARLDWSAEEVRALLDDMASFRGWKVDALPAVAVLSPEEFTRARTRSLRRGCEERSRILEERKADPKVHPRPEDCGALEAPRPRKNANIVTGFYSDDDQAVWLLDLEALLRAWGWPVDRAMMQEHLAQVLPHELHHHVQHQRLGRAMQEAELLAPDERRAWDALVEGDADLVALIQGARMLGYDWEFRLEKLLHQSLASPLQGHSYQHVESPFVGGDGNLERALVAGAYTSSMAFMIELYYQGGFKAIDRAYAHPPRSTEQVLHPKKYLAGELPVGAPEHALPPGMEVQRSTQDGELYLRAMLSTCTGWLRACELASGWAGDRWTWLEEGGKVRALVWTQVWDTEQDARKFFQPPDPEDQCLGKALAASLQRAIAAEAREAEKKAGKSARQGEAEVAAGPGGEAGPPTPTVISRLEGRKTGFVVGLEAALAEPILEAFFAAPVVVPPPEP